MSEFRLAPEAEAELNDIWLYIARESGSIDIAARVLEKSPNISGCLAQYPYLGPRSERGFAALLLGQGISSAEIT